MPGSQPNSPSTKGEGASTGEERPDTVDRLWEPVLEEHFRRSLSPLVRAKLGEDVGSTQKVGSVIKGVKSTRSTHTSPNPTTSPHQPPPISPYANHPFGYPPVMGGPPPPDPTYAPPYSGYGPVPPRSPHGAYYPPHAYQPGSPYTYGPPAPPVGAYGYGYPGPYPPPYYGYPPHEHPPPSGPVPRTPPQTANPAVDEHFKRSLPKAQLVDDHFAKSLAAGQNEEGPGGAAGATGADPVEDHFARSLAVGRAPGTSPEVNPPVAGRGGGLQRPYSTEGIEVRGPGGSPKDVDEHFKRALEKAGSPMKGRGGSKPTSPVKGSREKTVDSGNEPMDTD